MRYMRMDSSSCQTATHTYRHGSGRRVTVVGCFDFGEPAYYAAVRELISPLREAGALVHCEGSTLLTDLDPDPSAEEAEVLAAIRRLLEVQTGRLADRGWVTKVDEEGLGYPPGWQVVDLSPVQIMRRAGVDAFAHYVRVQSTIFELAQGEAGRAYFWAQVDAMLRMVGEIGVPPVEHSRLDEVLIGDRDRHALDAVAATGEDVVLVWAPGHQPGLDTGLRAQGFAVDGEPVWHSIARLPEVNGDAAGVRGAAVGG